VRRLQVVGLLLVAAVALAGCRPQAAAPAPTPDPSPTAASNPAGYRVGVVNLDALFRAHRRWPELDALSKKMDTLQLHLSSPPPPPELPRTAVGPDLQAEADRLKASLQGEIDAIRDQLRGRLEAHVNDLRAEQEAKLADRQRELNAELTKAVETKRDELQRELDQFELATMAEYRIPLLNLRVKADVVGISNEEEAKRIAQEGERLQKERDERIKAKGQALEKQIQEFSESRTADAESRLKAYITSLEEEARARIEAKDAEARAELQAAVRAREESLRSAMEARRKLGAEGVEAQVRAAQERYAKQVQAETARLRTELQAVAEQRFRLEDSMMAEIKIEVASVAQRRGIDAVVTRALARPGIVDLTPDVAVRLKRS
jgi:hypothetical protein